MKGLATVPVRGRVLCLVRKRKRAAGTVPATLFFCGPKAGKKRLTAWLLPSRPWRRRSLPWRRRRLRQPCPWRLRRRPRRPHRRHRQQRRQHHQRRRPHRQRRPSRRRQRLRRSLRCLSLLTASGEAERRGKDERQSDRLLHVGIPLSIEIIDRHADANPFDPAFCQSPLELQSRKKRCNALFVLHRFNSASRAAGGGANGRKGGRPSG